MCWQVKKYIKCACGQDEFQLEYEQKCSRAETDDLTFFECGFYDDKIERMRTGNSCSKCNQASIGMQGEKERIRAVEGRTRSRR